MLFKQFRQGKREPPGTTGNHRHTPRTSLQRPGHCMSRPWRGSVICTMYTIWPSLRGSLELLDVWPDLVGRRATVEHIVHAEVDAQHRSIGLNFAKRPTPIFMETKRKTLSRLRLICSWRSRRLANRALYQASNGGITRNSQYPASYANLNDDGGNMQKVHARKFIV